MTRKSLYTLLVVIQALFLLVMAGSYYGIDQFGKEVRLQTAPFDPRDLFYGDYVVLNYEISRLDSKLWQGAEQPEDGDAIYVVLKPAGNHYKAVAAHPDKPDVSGDEVVLRGTYEYEFEMDWFVTYGFERYYIPEGTGLEIEKQTRTGQATVVLKIAPWGQMKITDLILPKQ